MTQNNNRPQGEQNLNEILKLRREKFENFKASDVTYRNGHAFYIR